MGLNMKDWRNPGSYLQSLVYKANGSLRYNRIDAETIRDISEKPTKPATRNAWVGLQKMLGRMSLFLFLLF